MSRAFQDLFKDEAIGGMNAYSRGVFQQLSQCHTAALGWHFYQCDEPLCGQGKPQYHSCGNRHCPHCGSLKREAWVEERTNQLLPTAYYHVVFTLPHELNGLILGNRQALFRLLFESASETLLKYAANPVFVGGQVGITMVLHTWGQDLSFHPHLHCIVSGGGYADGQWIAAKRAKNNFIFPLAGLRKMYKALFLDKLRAATTLRTAGIDLGQLIGQIGHKPWNVYAKAPFGGPAQVVEYLGRYSHKIAITAHRILEVSHKEVRFRYQDYADGHQQKQMTLSRAEFLRRFEQHILPKGFVKIRHYGYLQNRHKHTRLNQIRKSLQLEPLKAVVQTPVAIRMLIKYGQDILKCPGCETGRLVLVQIYYPPKTGFPNKASPLAV